MSCVSKIFILEVFFQITVFYTCLQFFYWRKRESKEEGADIEYDATNTGDYSAAAYKNARDEAIPLHEPATKYEIDSKENMLLNDESGLQKAKTQGRSDKTRSGYDSGY